MNNDPVRVPLERRIRLPLRRVRNALPDNRQYRGLVDRPPELARERLGLVVHFVSRDGDSYSIDEVR